MVIKLDGQGRVEIPRTLRGQLGLKKGSGLEIEARANEIVLRKAGALRRKMRTTPNGRIIHSKAATRKMEFPYPPEPDR